MKSQAVGRSKVPLTEATIYEAFDAIVSQHPDRLALVFPHQGIELTYSEYRAEVLKLAARLRWIGVRKGDRVGIWSPNRYEWCVTQFATAAIGAVLVCINPAYRTRELQYALNKVGCKALITAEVFKSSRYMDMLFDLAPELTSCREGHLSSKELPALRSIICLGDRSYPGVFRYGDLIRGGQPDTEVEAREFQQTLSCRNPINIQFTSGTTGNPKGATLSHFNVLNNARYVALGMGLSINDRLCIPVPLYHCFGMVMGSLACVTVGAAAVFPGESFQPEETLQAVDDWQCTALHGVPTMFIGELALKNFRDFKLEHLRTGIMAGSPCPEEVMRSVVNKMNMNDVLIAYGQTETSPVNHMTDASDPLEKRVSTVGKASPHVEIKIVDDDGTPVPVGSPGEICVKGYSVMIGYWEDEAKTHETIRDSWLYSGDIGVMDQDGYVQVVGRIKDMIIRGGENVYPREIEEFLYTHPDVLEAQVFGVPDDVLGERVCVWIQTRTGSDLDEAAVRAFCKEGLAHFKVPSEIAFVTDFPMTVTGKIQKYKMREQAIEASAT